ncbi:TetR/AcrR family transcriptional regulator [Nocardioides sp.]|uniref:TetR/AcrR family transcriptional regulator n=1 Tax=Nocardioides sp. TaxID=35761 RepID=UPI002613ED75|nr:TetR/AcrR family transcriptional regulator [Nocardioides sp.]
MARRETERAAAPRQARGRRTREKVVAAAVACVAEEGFAAAHTNRIAERAGVTWGVLQYHFGDKDGLLDAVLERGMESVERAFAGLAIEGEDVHERVAAVVDAGWRVFTSPLALAADEIEINTRTPRADDPDHAANLLRMNRTLERLALDALTKALGKRPSRGVYGAFLATLRGFALTHLMTRLENDFARERRALTEMIVEASG